VPLRKEKHWAPGQQTDFDNFTSATLDDFRFVVTSNSAFTSQVPPNFHLVKATPQYQLWAREGPTPPRSVLAEEGSPGVTLDCTTSEGRALSRKRGVAHVIPEPVVSGPTSWSSDVKGAGDSASQQLKLPRGTWEIALQYVSREPVTASAGGVTAKLPANLARMGPFFPIGTVRSDGSSPVTVGAQVAKLGLFGRLLGAKGHTRALDSFENGTLGAVAATRTDVPGQTIPLRRACGRYVDWYRL